MKKLFLVLITALILFTGCEKNEPHNQKTFAEKLSELPNVVSVTAEEPGTFHERYKVFFKQPVDHDNPSAGTFNQRVYVMLNHPDSLNVLVTEGYNFSYDTRIHGLVPMFGANEIVVEHRYYGESVVDDGTYRYMNADNSCDDLHEIVTSLKSLLGGKWISTGGSKSGLTANMYRAWYPKDVNATVTNGAPFCEGRYDTRWIEACSNTIGTKDKRDKLLAFLCEALHRRDVMVPRFAAAAKADRVRFQVPEDELDQLWDLHIMDFQFAMWMGGHDINKLPSVTASDDDIFNYIVSVDGPDAWNISSDVPRNYYIQAYSELGHFANCTRGIKDSLVIKKENLDDYLRYAYVPKEYPYDFSTAMHEKVDAFLRSTDSGMIFLYGRNDPWFYLGVRDELINGKNICRYILDNSAHSTNITDFDEATRKEIKRKIESFLDM